MLSGATSHSLTVTTIRPSPAAPLRTLCLIYDSRGWQDRALECFMRAETGRTYSDLWKRNAAIWKEKGEIQNAIKCLSQALRGRNSEDTEALRARGHLFTRVGKLKMQRIVLSRCYTLIFLILNQLD